MEADELETQLKTNLGDMWNFLDKVSRFYEQLYELLELWEMWCRDRHPDLSYAATYISCHLRKDETNKQACADVLEIQNPEFPKSGSGNDDASRLLWAANELILIYPSWEHRAWVEENLDWNQSRVVQSPVQTPAVQYPASVYGTVDTQAPSGGNGPQQVGLPSAQGPGRPARPGGTSAAVQTPDTPGQSDVRPRRRHARARRKDGPDGTAQQGAKAPERRARTDGARTDGRPEQQKPVMGAVRKRAAARREERAPGRGEEAARPGSAQQRDRALSVMSERNTIIEIPGNVKANRPVSPNDIVDLMQTANLIPAPLTLDSFRKRLGKRYVMLEEGERRRVKIGRDEQGDLVLRRSGGRFILFVPMQFDSAKTVWDTVGGSRMRYWPVGGSLLLMPERDARSNALRPFMEVVCLSGGARKMGLVRRHLLVGPRGRETSAQAMEKQAWENFLKSVRPRYKLQVVAASEI
ncbi:hypothetical protein [Streptomyces sp. NBC_01614]|uniref:hypothetical protein n=1 Tax=Streptomyces sp. NBC_01614 TaxID=2975897 RepID=UPI003865CA2B